ncbi:hypothetical protein [Pseudomonas extremaustralis]|uniref:hypothetical protein n=1 Tax=Pseudomonas extremaustralis TaxID=359110 RepID=UPI002AA67F8C|nr:hypothetical protein [Pseudomonas extremaustralis]
MQRLRLGALALISLCFLIYITRAPKTTTVISAHIGKTYEGVARDSTFPIKTKTVIYPSDPPEPDSVWLRGSVIVKFDDPEHGFTLPPTKFGLVSFSDWKVVTITTSPMLETLPFDQLIPLLDHIQQMLKKSGWMPEFEGERHSWFKIENEADRNALQSLLFKQAISAALLVPRKYGMSLIVKCYARCDERDPNTARYLIDVSVGRDYSSR